MWGGGMPPLEENADLQNFTSDHAHQLLREGYKHFPHHNDGSHLGGGVADDAIWQHRWRRLAAQLAIWYVTPSGTVGCRFTAILAAEWQGVLGRSWNSKRPLVFAHVFLKNALGIRRAKEIHAQIPRRMDLWEKGLHVDLVVDSDAEGDDREGRATNAGEEEY